MPEITVFELSEVAGLLHLSSSTVKNWTIGRPLSIQPSIRAEGGTGSRNLYGRDDVCLFALVTQLTRDGFATRTLKHVLEELAVLKEREGGLAPVLAHYSTLVISSPHERTKVQFLAGDLTTAVHEQLREDVRGCYILDLTKLVKWVELRIKHFVEVPF